MFAGLVFFCDGGLNTRQRYPSESLHDSRILQTSNRSIMLLLAFTVLVFIVVHARSYY